MPEHEVVIVHSGVKKGDKFTLPPYGKSPPLFIEVTRCSRDGTWVDISVCNWAVRWTKRMPEGIPAAWPREDWTWKDIQETTPL